MAAAEGCKRFRHVCASSIDAAEVLAWVAARNALQLSFFLPPLLAGCNGLITDVCVPLSKLTE